MLSPSGLRQQVLARAAQAGAFRCGIAPVAPVPQEFVDIFNDWLAAGNHAGMAWLENYPDIRRDPSLLLPGAQSIIVCLFPYLSPVPRQCGPRVADYALGHDYHRVLRQALAPLCSWLSDECGAGTRVCIDSAPLRERYWATRAGLGFIGRNCQLIVPGVGSAFFIASVLCTLPVEADVPAPAHAGALCGSCRRCIDACPAKALLGNGALDARRCLSYLTIENRGPLPTGTPLQGNIYGCDACRLACPHSHPVDPAAILPELLPRPEILALGLDDWLEMSSSRFRRLAAPSAMRRTPLSQLRLVAELLRSRSS